MINFQVGGIFLFLRKAFDTGNAHTSSLLPTIQYQAQQEFPICLYADAGSFLPQIHDSWEFYYVPTDIIN